MRIRATVRLPGEYHQRYAFTITGLLMHRLEVSGWFAALRVMRVSGSTGKLFVPESLGYIVSCWPAQFAVSKTLPVSHCERHTLLSAP